MNMIIKVISAIVIFALIIVAWDGFYILPEGTQAVITQFGKPVGEPVIDAGFHIKTPFVQTVNVFEKKILIWDGDPNQIPTNDKTFVFLDITARWRISNALKFMESVMGS